MVHSVYVFAIYRQSDNSESNHKHNHICLMCMAVGAVAVFVDVCSFYMAHQYTFPGLLDNCARGWVNNIVVTSSGQIKVTLLTMISYITLHITRFFIAVYLVKVHVYVSQYLRILSILISRFFVSFIRRKSTSESKKYFAALKMTYSQLSH